MKYTPDDIVVYCVLCSEKKNKVLTKLPANINWGDSIGCFEMGVESRKDGKVEKVKKKQGIPKCFMSTTCLFARHGF